MGDMQFNGTHEEWDALVKKNKEHETLEEAALTLFPGDWSLTERELFKQGAEWQQEQMEKLKDFDTWKEWKNKSE